MIKIIREAKEENERFTTIGKMNPLQVGVIVSSPSNKGKYVMRTASIHKFEVLNLSHPREGGCWINEDSTVKVRLLNADESITIKLFNGVK